MEISIRIGLTLSPDPRIDHELKLMRESQRLRTLEFVDSVWMFGIEGPSHRDDTELWMPMRVIHGLFEASPTIELDPSGILDTSFQVGIVDPLVSRYLIEITKDILFLRLMDIRPIQVILDSIGGVAYVFRKQLNLRRLRGGLKEPMDIGTNPEKVSDI